MGQLSVYCCIWGTNVGLLVSQSSLSAYFMELFRPFLRKTLLGALVLLTDSGGGHVSFYRTCFAFCRREKCGQKAIHGYE